MFHHVNWNWVISGDTEVTRIQLMVSVALVVVRLVVVSSKECISQTWIVEFNKNGSRSSRLGIFFAILVQ